ncbi:MAG: VPLPA-CTERM sorting domain-containing protein [Sulfuricaulis sp.]
MTKFNLKTLVIAVALAATASQANAAMVNAQGTLGDGNSSVIMYAYSASLGRSYSRDLGFTLNDFLYNGTSAPTAGSYPFNSTLNTDMSIVTGNATDLGYTLSFGADSVMASWLGNGSMLASDVLWGIAAVDGQGTGSAFRSLTTVTIGASSAGTTNSELATFENKFDNFVAAHNALGTHVSGLNGSAGSDGSNAAAASAATGFGVNWGGASSFNAVGGVGQSMEFFFLAGNGTLGNTNVTSARYGNTEGFSTWTLNADSSFAYMAPGAVSAVPVPAAVWLFASGLLGLVGVSRRKKSA